MEIHRNIPKRLFGKTMMSKMKSGRDELKRRDEDVVFLCIGNKPRERVIGTKPGIRIVSLSLTGRSQQPGIIAEISAVLKSVSKVKKRKR